jgi:tRNA modification GTPase
VPGTTRDVIEEYVNISGVPLKIVDTAGIRETEDVVEKIGVERARSFLEHADLILLLLDASSPLTSEDREILSALPDRPTLVLLNKIDLPVKIDLPAAAGLAVGNSILEISTVSGAGLDQLEDKIVDMVYSGQVQQVEGSFVNNVRHAELLRQARQQLADVLVTINNGMPPDCMVVDLRGAWERLGAITGDTVGEDIIDQIFSQFCIGK